ncbi:DUF2511 domain-containing protein [Mycobacteroides abscessus]|uniref:DUF2511 domain-containing protein n=1 Tax=Mycobacteroides abscessus TaxID=36809 RepID=UPI00373FD053
MACQATPNQSPRKTVHYPDSHSLHVVEGTWADGLWPLTVSEGTLECNNMAVTFRTQDGATYAVNGTARSKHPGLEPIWKPSPEVPGARVNIGPLLNAGLKLCN